MSRKTPKIRATHVFINDEETQISNRTIKLPAEQPLEIRQNGTVTYSLMRTPGNDIELLHGLLFDEGKITSKEDLFRASYCAGTNSAGENTYNVLDVALAEQSQDQQISLPNLTVVPEIPKARGLPSLDIIHPRYLNSCGVCGTDKITEIAPTLPQFAQEFSVSQIQQTIDASALFSSGNRKLPRLSIMDLAADAPRVLVEREDIHPLHTAYKCTGWMLLNETMVAVSDSHFLALTNSQPTYEITKTLAKAGISAVLSVVEPTALAVELAQRTGMLLAHCPEPNRLFVFSGKLEENSEDIVQ